MPPALTNKVLDTKQGEKDFGGTCYCHTEGVVLLHEANYHEGTSHDHHH